MQEIRYAVDIDLSDKNSSHTLMHDMVQSLGRQSLNILDVGCSGGYLGLKLKSAGHRVSGVEMDPVAAQHAKTLLDEVYCGTVQDFFAQNPNGKYDVILYGDVLEHIGEPSEVLQLTKQHLHVNGRLIASVPNVSHIGMRWMLALGQWNYEDWGIMDRTHLRFFTRSSLLALLSESDFSVESIERTMLQEAVYMERHHLPCDSNQYRIFRDLVADAACEDYQYIVMASVCPPSTATEKNKEWERRALREQFPATQKSSAREQLAHRWKALRSSWRELWHEVLIEANAHKSPLANSRDAGLTQKWRALRLLKKLGKKRP
jgi:2-polyprenyl-3-methyl-5-hydroxy-6-metoxy-1,4-benzoquinol methylase